MQIPLSNLKRQYDQIKTEINYAIQSVLDSTYYILGPDVFKFEEEFAEYNQSKYCISVANGTDAISIGLKALGVKPGDYVITVANTFIATTEAISSIGANLALVDAKAEDLLIDPILVEHKILELINAGKTVSAIIPVHLYGNYCDMLSIKEIADKYKVKILEDASQAHGAEKYGRKIGYWSDIATFSFYPGKNLGAYGDAGAIITNNSDYADLIKMLRNHGRNTGEKYSHQIEGYNSRMDSLQAAILRVKLKYLERWTDHRIESAHRYSFRLSGTQIETPRTEKDTKHVFHLYVIQSPYRDKIHHALMGSSIQSGIHYPIPIHKLPAYCLSDSFPVVELAASRILSLPIDGTISLEEVNFVSNSIIRELEDCN